MKAISTVGWSYLVFGMGTCGYFCAAAIGGWSGPSGIHMLPGISHTPNSSSGTGTRYTGGSSHGSTFGRSLGGSWGGGK